MDEQRPLSSIIDLTSDPSSRNSDTLSADRCFPFPLDNVISSDTKPTPPDTQIELSCSGNFEAHNIPIRDIVVDLENVERETWGAYGMEGKMDSDFLLKEVQRRVGALESASRTYAFDLERLNCLKELHRFRLDGTAPTRTTSGIDGKKKEEKHKLTPCAPQEKMADIGSRMWALLIGINDYPASDLSPLKGCINDVEAMREYLTKYLFVPSLHISSLCDEMATRSRILDALYDLRDNTSITSGDNILITFFGHGSSHDADECFQSITGRVGSVEALCPIDRGSKDASGNVVPDISDRELNIILGEIGTARTANITLIFDCCFAGGTTRSGSAPPISKQTKQPLPPLEHGLKMMLDAADCDPRRISSVRASVEEWEPDLSYHVLLASCLYHQKAHEAQNPKTGRAQGVFLRALLEVLQSEESLSATYSDIIDWIGPLGSAKVQLPQTPIAVGKRCGSRLWFQDVEKVDNCKF